jgi:hypothetical protein
MESALQMKKSNEVTLKQRFHATWTLPQEVGRN